LFFLLRVKPVYGRRWVSLSVRGKFRLAFTLVELLAALSIITALVALIFPAVQSAREAARKVQCGSNLKQLALGVMNFESSLRQLPSGGWGKRWAGLSGAGFGRAQPGGWIFQTLPYLEQQAVYELGSNSSPTGDPVGNAQRLATPLSLLHCPSRRGAERFANPRPWTPIYHSPVGSVARNDYAFNGGSIYVRYTPGPDTLEQARDYAWVPVNGSTGLCFQRSEVRLRDVNDGLSQTYLLGEKHVPRSEYYLGEDWGDNESAYSGDDRDLIRFTGRPGDRAFNPISDGTPFSNNHDKLGGMVFGSGHSSIFQMAMADGSIHHISYSIDQYIHSILGSRADGKTASNEVFR
jgi:type II secretory pathway pseudopilin PulG